MMRIVGPDPSGVTLANMLDFFQLRRHVFVNALGWTLSAPGGFEFDQYDLPFARFVIAYQKGRCVGGVRLAPTDVQSTQFGIASTFMIQDFLEGRLPSPMSYSDMTAPLPFGPGIWEMTRFVSDGFETTKQLMCHADSFLLSQGATQVLALTRPLSNKLLSRLGFDTQQISRNVIFEDGKHYAAFSMQVGWSRTQNAMGRTNFAA